MLAGRAYPANHRAMSSGARLALSCALLVSAACGSSEAGFTETATGGSSGHTGGAGGNANAGSGGKANGGKSSVAFSDLPTELATAYCAIIEQCFGTYAELVPQSDCEPRLAKQFTNGWFASTQAALDAGVVAYDPVKARACVDALAAQGCELFSARSPAVCDEALSGEVPLGGPCSVGAECAGDAYCDHGAAACPGACAVRRDSGQDCAADEECVSGLTCQTLTCRAPAAAGHACGGDSEPECRTGLVCLGASETSSGVCADTAIVTSVKLGQSCDVAQQRLCEPNLSCRLVSSAPAAFTCQAKSASGQACSLGLPEPCPRGEYCKTEAAKPLEGLCAPLPGAGEPCVTGGIHLLTCDIGLVCVTGSCKEVQDNGVSCSAAAECHGGHCTNGTCSGDDFCTP